MNEEQLSEIFDYYAALPDPRRQENLVAMLREIQDVLGCVPDGWPLRQPGPWGETRGPDQPGAPVLHPEKRGVEPPDHGLQRRALREPGRAPRVYRALCEVLRPGPDGVSENGRVLLCTQNCLKQCRTSPNIAGGRVLHPHDPESARELARKLLEE